MNISVVIITKNEAHIIGNTLESIRGVTDDIVVVDSGSTDDTIAICRKYGALIIETDWAGYGINKNMGIEAARHNWILSLDADEAIDAQLAKSILQLQGTNEKEVFDIRFKNFFCNQWIRFGEWGFDRHIRLFNRNTVQWNHVAVHENLVFPDAVIKTRLAGNILHYTVQNREEYAAKTDHYARMNAGKYVAAGRRPSLFKQYFSPLFAFLQHYIFRLGFLDGSAGFIIAKTTARYTFLKYRYLKQMNNNSAKNLQNL